MSRQLQRGQSHDEQSLSSPSPERLRAWRLYVESALALLDLLEGETLLGAIPIGHPDRHAEDQARGDERVLGPQVACGDGFPSLLRALAKAAASRLPSSPKELEALLQD